MHDTPNDRMHSTKLLSGVELSNRQVWSRLKTVCIVSRINVHFAVEFICTTCGPLWLVGVPCSTDYSLRAYTMDARCTLVSENCHREGGTWSLAPSPGGQATMHNTVHGSRALFAGVHPSVHPFSQRQFGPRRRYDVERYCCISFLARLWHDRVKLRVEALTI